MNLMPRLTGSGVSLRTVLPEDAGKWYAWLNDPEVAVPLGDEAYTPMTPANMERDIESISSSREHVFTIVENESGNAIGRCLLFSIEFVNRSAMVGIFIGEKSCWNKGYGRESLILLLDYAFNMLNLNSLMLGVMSFNERAIRCYESVGFKEVGRRREARIIGDVCYDGILMDILAREFRVKYNSPIKASAGLE